MTPSSPCSASAFMTEDDLTRIKKLVLTSLRTSLVQSLDPRLFLCVFRQEFVLNARECDTIKTSCGRSVYEGAETMLDILETKGSRGYDVLCRALLYDRTQLHLLTALEETLTQFKYNFRMYIEAQIKAEELHKKEMELNKQYTQAKCSPQPTSQYLSHGFKAQHRSRSPMPTDETTLTYHPAHTSSNYQENTGLYPGEQAHRDAFAPSPPYPQYQQTVPFIQYPEAVPACIGLGYHQYSMYEQVYSDSAIMSHDIPCGQQGH